MTSSIYVQATQPRATPPTEALDDRQVPNHAGGFVYTLTPWQHLHRFLILGTVGGTYYVTAKKHTQEHVAVVTACLAEDPGRVLTMIREVSTQGRAVSNDPAIAALALTAASPDPGVRKQAMALLPVVCRIPTHLFLFLQILTGLRGWSRGLRQAVSTWYLSMAPSHLAYEVVKYQRRHGWSHRDVLRLAHPKGTGAHAILFGWITQGVAAEEMPIIEGFVRCKATTRPATIAALIQEYGLTHEMVPSAALNHAEVWDALLEHMPLTAMIRNLGKMSSLGLVVDLSTAAGVVSTRLRDADYLRTSRVHPLTVLVAMKIYAQGHGMKGHLQWPVSRQVLDALDDAFYATVGNVLPSGKRVCLALDISGSMGFPLSGLPLSCRDATAAMALITARVESQYTVVGFSHQLVDLPISPRQRLEDVVRTISSLPAGATDCALPMLDALATKQQVEGFFVYTDCETWAGALHPMQALRQYRDTTGIAAKLGVIGMISTGFTIADPQDAGCLDVVGFDTATPAVLSAFLAA